MDLTLKEGCMLKKMVDLCKNENKQPSKEQCLKIASAAVLIPPMIHLFKVTLEGAKIDYTESMNEVIDDIRSVNDQLIDNFRLSNMMIVFVQQLELLI